MMKQVCAVLAAGVLAGGMSAASAATMSHAAMSNAGSTSSSVLSLTASQQTTAWQDLKSEANNQKAPSSFSVRVGEAVPAGVKIKPISGKTATAVPKLKAYDFAIVRHKILIVNPTNGKIADVISG
jgi:hypothetical protein